MAHVKETVNPLYCKSVTDSTSKFGLADQGRHVAVISRATPFGESVCVAWQGLATGMHVHLVAACFDSHCQRARPFWHAMFED